MIDETTLKKNVARNLETVMTETGISQNRLAKHLRLSQPTLSRMLAQITVPNTCDLANIAELFGLKIDDLISDRPVRAKNNLQKKLSPQS